MSIRKEVLENLEVNIRNHNIIPLSKCTGMEANKAIEQARKGYEDARGELLYQELGRFYRVVIFGSARLQKDSEEFIFVTNLAKSLVVARDVDIVTGGGTGIMEAAHYGTQLAIKEASSNGKIIKARNHGVAILNLPIQEPPSEFAHFAATHPEFSPRLQAFMDKSHAAYLAVGGIGSLLELMMLVQTRQVGHLEREYPVITHPFYKPIVDSWNDQMYHNRVATGLTPLISESDLTLITFTDKIPEIVDIISRNYDDWKERFRNHVRIVS